MNGAQIDRLVASGQISAAAEQLAIRLMSDDGEPADWLKLAGLQRALKQPRHALQSVHRALAKTPLDLVALTMRAGLLQHLAEAGAAQAWSEAIAQKPAGPVPPPLAAALAAGERFHAQWQAGREMRLVAAAQSMRDKADEDEAWRIARFTDTILRKTRVYHSESTHFAYPGLVEREFHPRGSFPWIAALEAQADAIRLEALALLACEGRLLEPYIAYEDHEALAQWRPLNRNPDWSALHLWQQGRRVTANADRAPRTMAALAALAPRRVPEASPNAMFSLLAPRTAIPAHVGVDNTRLVCHLPLVVPPSCWFRVGAETRPWEEGKVLVFDDTIEHEAYNPSDQLRIVLIFDVWHPGLSMIEREAVSAMVASEGGSSLT